MNTVIIIYFYLFFLLFLSKVYDWYAACEWDAVARVSACEWAGELFKKNYRTVWIDTPTARSLITASITNDTNFLQSNLDSISDFRDIAFPAVLNCAKRSIVDAKLQYSKHFIVRFVQFILFIKEKN